MENSKLIESHKIYFKGEKLPMELIARSKRYAVVVRALDIEEDYDLIYFEVERGAYFNTEEAFNAIKENPVYSLIDFQEEKRAPSNLVFNPWDFWSKEDCVECINELDKGSHQLSTRHGAELSIDWERTEKSN